MKAIPLYRGREDVKWVATSQVDDDDYHYLVVHQWRVQTKTGKDGKISQYAVRYECLNGLTSIFLMARDIACRRLSRKLEPSEWVDHKNGDTLNNSWDTNLRLVNVSQNTINRRKKVSASRFRGITPRPKKKGVMWEAKIVVGTISKYLGTFQSDVEAAKAYDVAARALHGEFAVVNF